MKNNKHKLNFKNSKKLITKLRKNYSVYKITRIKINKKLEDVNNVVK